MCCVLCSLINVWLLWNKLYSFIHKRWIRHLPWCIFEFTTPSETFILLLNPSISMGLDGVFKSLLQINQSIVGELGQIHDCFSRRQVIISYGIVYAAQTDPSALQGRSSNTCTSISVNTYVGFPINRMWYSNKIQGSITCCCPCVTNPSAIKVLTMCTILIIDKLIIR